MTGISMARSTRSGTGLGPGMFRKWRPWCMVMDSSLVLPDEAYCIQFWRHQLLNCVQMGSTETPRLSYVPPHETDDPERYARAGPEPRSLPRRPVIARRDPRPAARPH